MAQIIIDQKENSLRAKAWAARASHAGYPALDCLAARYLTTHYPPLITAATGDGSAS